MINDYLPIGSVVQLSDSTALLMIAGYLPVVPSRPDYVWDYSGFKFPIGCTDNEEIYCFDNSQIETVYAHGYIDVEQEFFISKLIDARELVKDIAKVKNEEAVADDAHDNGGHENV